MWLVFQPSPSCTLCVGWGSSPWQRRGTHTCTLTLCVYQTTVEQPAVWHNTEQHRVHGVSCYIVRAHTRSPTSHPLTHTPVLLLYGRQLNVNSALSGTIPSNLGQIATLEQLYAQDTSLSGSLPDLSNTQLSVL